MNETSMKTHAPYIVAIGLLVLIVIAEFAYYHHKSDRFETRRMITQSANKTKTGNRMGGPSGMAMAPQTPPPTSDQQTQQLAMGVLKTSTQKTFNITGGNFYFVPNKITVNKGDQVTLVMTNAGGVHDLIIDELSVKTPVIHTAEAASVTFTASKVGSFVYYCDIPGHKDKGMLGTLIVQ